MNSRKQNNNKTVQVWERSVINCIAFQNFTNEDLCSSSYVYRGGSRGRVQKNLCGLLVHPLLRKILELYKLMQAFVRKHLQENGWTVITLSSLDICSGSSSSSGNTSSGGSGIIRLLLLAPFLMTLIADLGLRFLLLNYQLMETSSSQSSYYLHINLTWSN